MPETITTSVTVYTLDELEPAAQERAVETVREKLGGDWWDSHNIEAVGEVMVYTFAEKIGTPGREEWGVADFPGIDGIKLDGWDLDRGQTILFSGTLTRENAPALPWLDGIVSVELNARRDYVDVDVIESDDPEVRNTTREESRAMREAVETAMHAAWIAGEAEAEYITSAENAREDIEANERRFLADGTLY